MYVQQTIWYKKQQRKRAWCKGLKYSLVFFTLVLFVCLGIWSVPMNYKFAGWEKIDSNLSEQVQAYEKSDSEDGDNVIQNENIFEEQPVLESETEPIITKENDGVYIIAIDMGHGGEDEGCSYEGVEEKEINLKLGYQLKDKLENMGFRVVLIRETDEGLDLNTRVERVKQSNADILISIHQNASEDKTVSGIESWYFPDEEVNNERLARLVQQYTVLYSKGKDRGIMESKELLLIRESGIPSCLVETGFLSNRAERSNLTDDLYCSKLVQGLADAVELYFYPKTMYLTFDDGPNTENTNKILDILKENDIKATFFVVGKNVERNPETTRRIVEEGHAIGIHCYNHDYSVIYNSVDDYINDFEKARQIVYEVTGVEANVFRFPGGSINSYNKKVYKNIIEAMSARGYVYYDWNASLEDAVKRPDRNKILKNAKESTLGREVVIMLGHDTIDVTVEVLDELLKLFPEYKFKVLDETVEQIRF